MEARLRTATSRPTPVPETVGTTPEARVEHAERGGDLEHGRRLSRRSGRPGRRRAAPLALRRAPTTPPVGHAVADQVAQHPRLPAERPAVGRGSRPSPAGRVRSGSPRRLSPARQRAAPAGAPSRGRARTEMPRLATYLPTVLHGAQAGRARKREPGCSRPATRAATGCRRAQAVDVEPVAAHEVPVDGFGHDLRSGRR